MEYELVGKTAVAIVGICAIAPLFGKEENRPLRNMGRVMGITMLSFAVGGWMLPGLYKAGALLGFPAGAYFPLIYARLLAARG